MKLYNAANTATLKVTDAERAEQQTLRQEYLAGFRRNLHAQLDNIYLVDENGNKRKLEKKQ